MAANIVIMEKDDQSVPDQKIKYIDWSDQTNKNWSRDWINSKLNLIIEKKLSKKDWEIITPHGDHNVLIPPSEDALTFDNSLVLTDIFEKVIPGAEPGLTPLFLDINKEDLLTRIRSLFSIQKLEIKG